MTAKYPDSMRQRCLLERVIHWDKVAHKKARGKRPGKFYHKLLRHYYRLAVPQGLRVLELGCGQGDLLATLKPSFGLGIDFSGEMLEYARRKHPGLCFVLADAQELPLREKFDVVILSDLVNDLWDVQEVLMQVARVSHAGTRIIVNYHNHLWRFLLAMANFFGIGAETLEQNWLSPVDVVNLLNLTGLEPVSHRRAILLPFKIKFLSAFANRFLVNFVPFSWFALANFVVARRQPDVGESSRSKDLRVSVIVPARNEAGNIENIIRRLPEMGRGTELIFIEGHSKDGTYAAIEQAIAKFPDRNIKLLRQNGQGKGDAVRLGFETAAGDVLMILDADMTVPPADLTRFFNALAEGRGEFINGVRLVYPMQDQSMRFFNMAGNKFFSLAFSWLLQQPVKDTLCGTKVLLKDDYLKIASNRNYFGEFDPFGDFDLLFGAAKLNMKIIEIPVRYRARMYGETNIHRWSHGWLLLKMMWFAALRIKFI
jgi:SAM-dependent methyltransferase